MVWTLTASTNGVLRLLRIDPNAQEDEVSEEEIRMMVDVGSEKGTIDHEEKEFIQNVFEFDDLSAGELVTHRTDVIMLDIEDSMDTWNGLIFHTIGSIPEDGKGIEIEISGLQIKVIEIKNHQVETAIVHLNFG